MCDCVVCEYGRQVRDFMERTPADDDKKFIEGLYDRLIHAEDDAGYWKLRFGELKAAREKRESSESRTNP